jgi:hypothetical protein
MDNSASRGVAIVGTHLTHYLYFKSWIFHSLESICSAAVRLLVSYDAAVGQQQHWNPK